MYYWSLWELFTSPLCKPPDLLWSTPSKCCSLKRMQTNWRRFRRGQKKTFLNWEGSRIILPAPGPSGGRAHQGADRWGEWLLGLPAFLWGLGQCYRNYRPLWNPLGAFRKLCKAPEICEFSWRLQFLWLQPKTQRNSSTPNSHSCQLLVSRWALPWEWPAAARQVRLTKVRLVAPSFPFHLKKLKSLG